MTFLNPLALILFLPIFLLFKEFANKKQDKQSKLLFLALLLLVASLSRPALSESMSSQNIDANEYIIALDVSYSMQANDVQPSRYLAAKESIHRLLEENTKDIFSLFAFTSNTLLLCPPTTDTQIARHALEALNPDFILTKGTSLSKLLEQVSKLLATEKKLIVFSDGGEESDLNKLLEIASKANIVVNVVAVGSENGAVLEHDKRQLRDANNNLVISRINPLLKDLAKHSGGFYYEMSSQNNSIHQEVLHKLRNDAANIKNRELSVQNHKELYYYPLALAFFIILLSVTKIKSHIPFLSIVAIALPLDSTHASLLDFHHIDKANALYANKNYKESLQQFQKLSPSTQSYFNIANAYYKQKNYKKAMEYYSVIMTKDVTLKKAIYYNMGNCAVKMKRYDRAKEYFKKALALGYDKDAFFNLDLLNKLALKERIDVADMMPHQNPKEQKNSTKKNESKKEENQNAKGNSNQKSSIKNSGSGEQKSEKDKKTLFSQHSQNQYQMGYKAYELINQGYTNEQNPW